LGSCLLRCWHEIKKTLPSTLPEDTEWIIRNRRLQSIARAYLGEGNSAVKLAFENSCMILIKKV